MQSEVSELSAVLVELKVEVPWERVQKGMNENFDRIAKTARIKGFRPGKVPQSVVRKLFAKQVKGEVAAQLIEESLVAACEKHDLSPVGQPEIQPPNLEQEKPLSFTAKLEVRPKIEKVNTEGLEVYRSAAEVSDEDVQNEIERLREQHAELRAPEPMRPAKEGDQLLIDYKVFLDGEEKTEMGATDRWVELGSGRLLSEFETALTGAQPGESKSIEVTFPEDHGSAELKGKTPRFEVSVRELREKILPEVDDEFAKDVGDYQTLLELRLKVREQLESAKKQRAESELRDRLIDKFVDINDIAVPPSMVRQQEQQMLYELVSFLQMTGQDMPMTGDLQKDMKARAERRVRAGLLLGALAREQNVQIGEADVEARLQKIAEETGKHIAKVRVDYQGERRSQLESQLLEEKLMDILLSRAKIMEGEPPAAETPEDASEPKQGQEE